MEERPAEAGMSWLQQKYIHCDKGGRVWLLHDCIAEKAALEGNVLTFFFPEGIWVPESHKANAAGKTVRTDAAKACYHLADDGETAVYVFKEKKNGKTVRKEWPLSKLLDKLNSGELRLEFLCEYRDWHRRLIECWLWDEAHSWRACEIRFTAEPLYYCWNRLREDAAI